MNEPEVLRAMLSAKKVAVIGVSDNPAKPSNYVSRYLQQAGCRVLPVNPTLETVLGEKSYPSLTELVAAEGKPELVDVFRLPNAIPAIVDEMLALGLENLWVQQGIVNLDAAQKAEQGGIRVVMDHCLMVEHRRGM
ncbi:CoA-binding protein [Terriglobus tenax]|uniref:CoA-binding protein n=1 Tax=Terriglobus tenax TaxID=1111115 RepID=UPI0021E0C836|nr:CoA-binding protein [Terriglobus tenax]